MKILVAGATGALGRRLGRKRLGSRAKLCPPSGRENFPSAGLTSPARPRPPAADAGFDLIHPPLNLTAHTPRVPCRLPNADVPAPIRNQLILYGPD
jgi:hypothetical protein